MEDIRRQDLHPKTILGALVGEYFGRIIRSHR